MKGISVIDGLLYRDKYNYETYLSILDILYATVFAIKKFRTIS